MHLVGSSYPRCNLAEMRALKCDWVSRISSWHEETVYTDSQPGLGLGISFPPFRALLCDSLNQREAWYNLQIQFQCLPPQWSFCQSHWLALIVLFARLLSGTWLIFLLKSEVLVEVTVSFLSPPQQSQLQPRLLYPAEPSFRIKGQIKGFSDKEKLEFITTNQYWKKCQSFFFKMGQRLRDGWKRWRD